MYYKSNERCTRAASVSASTLLRSSGNSISREGGRRRRRRE